MSSGSDFIGRDKAALESASVETDLSKHILTFLNRNDLFIVPQKERIYFKVN